MYHLKNMFWISIYCIIYFSGVHDVMLIQNPQYLGPAHIEQSVYLSSCHDQVVELVLVDGKSVGRSDFCIQKSDCTSIASNSSGRFV